MEISVVKNLPKDLLSTSTYERNAHTFFYSNYIWSLRLPHETTSETFFPQEGNLSCMNYAWHVFCVLLCHGKKRNYVCIAVFLLFFSANEKDERRKRLVKETVYYTSYCCRRQNSVAHTTDTLKIIVVIFILTLVYILW